MVIHDKKLYVGSTYFSPNWRTYVGNSVIDLSNDKVEKNNLGITDDYGADMVVINNTVTRSYKGGIAAPKPDLTADTKNIIGKTSSTYATAAFGKYIFLTDTDYQAPDNVYVYDSSGALVHQYKVGAIPGSFVVFEKEAN